MAYTPGAYSGSKSGYTPGAYSGGASGYTPGAPRKSKKLDSSENLYNLAVKSGLKNRADSLLASQSGESQKKFFSGGFISDVFDVLNAAQYGVVGLVKGKSFMEGVNTRQSFSDKDSLGDKGLPGVIAGTLLDIAFDPFTYIAPYTIVKKLPILSKLVKGAEAFTFGKKVSKTYKTSEGIEKTVETLEGGTKTGKYLAQKLGWVFGVDPIFRQIWERGLKNTAVESNLIVDMGKSIGKLMPGTASKLITKDKTGRFMRVGLEKLKGTLSPEELDPVIKIYTKIDELGRQAVDLKLLSKEKYEENIGSYLKNAYEEFELAKKKGLFGSAKVGFKKMFKRKEGLTPEKMKELGQIDNPAYLLFKSAFDLNKQVQDATLLRKISTQFGTDVAQEGFTQIPKTSRFITSAGKQSEILGGVKKINTDLKPLFSGLKQTFKADKKVLGEIAGLEKQFSDLGKLQGEELYKFFNGATDITKTIRTSRKLGIIPDILQPTANSVKKYKTFAELQKSADGIQLEKLFLDGDLERNGFKSMEHFFDTVKNPFKASEVKDITKLTKDAPEFTIKGDVITEVKGGKQVSRNMDEIEKRLYDTKVAKEGLPLKSRIMEGVSPKPTKIVSKELDLLKQKISNFNKGYKFAGKEISENQSKIIKVIKENFSQSERGQFLSAIKKATTKENTLELIEKLKNTFEDLAVRADDISATKNISKVVKLQKQIETVLSKSKTLKEIDKRSINDSFRTLEKSISDLNFSKENLLESLADAKLGDLAGKYVPNHMVEYINEVTQPSVGTLQKQLVANFKFFKVVMNPGTHARNIISNKILNYWKLGMNPLDPRTIKANLIADSEILKGGGKWIDEAKPLGYGLDTFASAEMKGLLDSQEASIMGRIGKLWQTTKKKLGDIYQMEENQAKLSAYIFSRTTRGLEPEEAWKAAESATFNYAQVTLFVRKLRESLFGFPFITFTVKSTPVVTETMIKNPGRISVIGKIKQNIEKLADVEETERERASEPSWVKNGFYVKLPMKDSKGRSAYFDLTYILPFGDLLAGNFFETGQNMQTGLPESKITATMNKSPFIQMVTAIGKNQDFYGNSIWKKSDTSEKQLRDLMVYLGKSYLPPLAADELPGGYNDKGVRQQKGFRGALNQEEEENQKRTIIQEMARSVGAKIQPIDADIQETYTEWNRQKALRNLLLESGNPETGGGVINDLSILYQPKEKK